MARHAVAVATVLFHSLLGLVCAMPGPGAPGQRPGGGPRLQCPSCLRPFRSARDVRIHKASMGPASLCGTDMRGPVTSGWSSRGPRAAGRVEDLSGRGFRLPGMSDTESDTDRARSPRRMHEDFGGGPVGEHEDPAAEPEDPSAADPQEPQHQVQIHANRRNTRIFMHIHTIYIHIHTNTYRYVHSLLL